MRSVFDARSHQTGPRSIRLALPARHARAGKRVVRNLFWSFLCATLLLAQLQPAWAQDDSAQHQLELMSTALRETDYQGFFIYEHNDQIDALRLFHASGSPERERLVSMSGARSEIVRDNASLTCMQTGLPTVSFENRAGARLLPLVPNVSALATSPLYAVSAAGEDRMAGYRARIVEISARDGYRYGYRLWLEENSHLPLRSALVDNARRTLEQFMFVTLDVGAKPKKSDLLADADSGTSTPAEEAPLPGPPQWRVADPPPGFTLLRAQRPAQGPTPAEHHMYSDGVADVSVYIEPRDPNAPVVTERAMARGALHVCSRDVGAWRITALGDVPRATVERIARSVQAVSAQNH